MDMHIGNCVIISRIVVKNSSGACLSLLFQVFDLFLDHAVRHATSPCTTGAAEQDLLIHIHVAQEFGGWVQIVNSDLMPLLGESIAQVRASIVERGEFLVLVWGLIVTEIPCIGEAEVTDTIGLRY